MWSSDDWRVFIRVVYVWPWVPFLLLMISLMNLVSVPVVGAKAPDAPYYLVLGLLSGWAYVKVVSVRRAYRQDHECPGCQYDRIDCHIKRRTLSEHRED